ncbi:GntR family transcriptional regulator [Streptomyces sp. NPDC001982]|uniref:GntR family transcriptional regulator n=1 Tax=Streptomyces sp. NPDC001982 TaxID=3154405 RepID=UPI00332585A8
MSTTGLRPLPPRAENLTEAVFEAIRDGIVNKVLTPEARISEANVASQLNVSKTPVREALLRLRHIGLVEPAERGLRVIRPSVKAIRDAYEFRAGIERTAAQYAAHRATTEEHERILLLAHSSLKYADAQDGAGFRQFDLEFHKTIANCARNVILQQAVKDSLVLTSVLRQRDVPASGDSVTCAQEHIRVAQAIRAGDAETAAREAADHIHHVMAIVLTVHPVSDEPDGTQPSA